MARATEFEQFIADEVEKNRGTMVPVKASLAERMFVRKARWQQLHPNPDDEFCFPSIGPNYSILSDYAGKYVYHSGEGSAFLKDPLIVQKVPSHYRISLHVDDEAVIVTSGRQMGFNVYQLDADDDSWKEKVIARADEIRRREELFH